MQSNRSVYFCLFLIFIVCGFYINRVAALWDQCDEVPKNVFMQSSIAYQEEPIHLEIVVKDLLYASFGNDTIGMDRVVKSLKKIKIKDDENDATTAAPITTTEEHIKREGYPAETHVVITEDGYVLELIRIPYSPQSPKTEKPKRPVFLMHGLMESANGWIVLGSQNSLAYLLADAGYDVWMGNARGTERSRKHVSLEPTGKTSKQFWSFSWHEIGIYDLPASIDYVLNRTNQEQLQYVGYSQGTTSFFAMASMRPEYNKKIISANLMAPTAYLQYIRGPFDHFLTWYYTPLRITLNALRIYELTKDRLSHKLLKVVENVVCQSSILPPPSVCGAIAAIVETNQINCTSVPLIEEHIPAGASIRQLIHYAQLIRGDDFKLFDYDSKRMNEKIYGTPKPPKYDLKKISAEVNLFYSKDDGTATLPNALRLQSELPNVNKRYIVPVDKFNHVDFVYSVNAKEGVNSEVVATINEYDSKLVE